MWGGGKMVQIDDRSLLVKYYQAAFFSFFLIYQHPLLLSWYHTENSKMWSANDLPF